MNWPVVLILAIVLMMVLVSSRTWGMQRVKASNGRIYLVQENVKGDAAQAAEQLARLEARVNRFVEYMDASEQHRKDSRVVNVVKRWAGKLSEVNNLHSFDAAYSINKSDIAICIRDAEGNLQDDETAMFILLHELGHLSIDDYGHTEEFWTAFRFLLKIAIEDAKVYQDQNFENFPVQYCDHPIRSSPYTCYKLGNCSL